MTARHLAARGEKVDRGQRHETLSASLKLLIVFDEEVKELRGVGPVWECLVAALAIESTGSPVGLLPRCYLWQDSKDIPVDQVPDLSGATRRSRTGDLLITNQ